MSEAKSCSRCGNRRRSEEHPNGSFLLNPYWDRSTVVCQTCARELNKAHDLDGTWPAGGNAAPKAEPEAPAPEKRTDIEFFDPKGKPRKVPCVEGPLAKQTLSCYRIISMVVPMPDGVYEYDQGKYVWKQGDAT